MGRCSRECCHRTQAAWMIELEDIRKDIRKNYGEMDFENAFTCGEMETILENMDKLCDELAGKL